MIALQGVQWCFYSAYNHRDLVPRISRSLQLSLPRGRLSFARASFDYEVLGFPTSRLVSPSVFTAEKEEAKSTLTLFLKKQGLSDAATETTVNNSDMFIDHLVSRLPFLLHQSRDRAGRELSTLEIRDALIPYLESLVEEHGELLVDFVENFQKPPIERKPIRQPVRTIPESQLHQQMSKMAVEQVHDKSLDGTLRPNFAYLMNLGMDLKHVKGIARKYPHLPSLSLEQELIPTVEFLLNLGVHKSDLHKVLMRAHSKKKIVEIVCFFDEVGVPTESVGKILTKYPNIAARSIEDNLMPVAKFFQSLGINVARFERVWELKMATVSKKYDYFLTLGYPREELVKFPSYFGYSLEGRIKPRFELVKKHGLKLSLCQVLVPIDDKFHSGVAKKVMKLHYRNSSHVEGPDGTLYPNIVYLMNLGLDLNQIAEIGRKYKHLPPLSLEQNLIPTIKFLLDLGVRKANIPSILKSAPTLFKYRTLEKLNSAVAILESLGVDKNDWGRVIERYPRVLLKRKEKIEKVVGFFYEMGVPAKNVGKIFTKYAGIACCSVEDNLLPTAKFLHSLGIDVALQLCQYPDVFCYSTEKHVKPIAEFFLANGFSTEDLARMIAKFGCLWGFKLATLSMKYAYFLTLDYPKEELIRYPFYFSYSLEGRLKPRFELLKEYGLKLPLCLVVSRSDVKFHSGLKKKLRKFHSGNTSDIRNDG